MKKIIISFLCGITLAVPIILAQSSPFSDVNPDDWFYEAVVHLVEWGIIEGNPDGNFQPSRNVNRATLAVVTDRYHNYANTQFVLKSDTPGSDIEILNHSLTQGETSWVFSGSVKNNSDTQAQFVQIVLKIFDNNNEEIHTDKIFTKPSTLGSGGEGTFEFTFSPFENYDHYEILAYK